MMEQPDDLNRDEIIRRMVQAGLYSPAGTTKEQRGWVKARDGQQCQFYEFKGGIWVQCDRKEGSQPRGRERWRLEVHHIVPQSEMKSDPKKEGGERPDNLITLCAGLKGAIGHHDIMQPTMIIAKMTYRVDASSYERWIGYAHRAREIDGMSTYVREWDGMLKTIARTRSAEYTQKTGLKFPFHKGGEA